MRLGRAVLTTAALAALGLPPAAAEGGDSAAAERQYRIARRLVAERSPDAASALDKVIELDPTGPLADDALVDRALLEGLPRWPEELGAIGADPARRAMKLLERVTVQFPKADRTTEARYRLALLRLEPLAVRDASAARQDLIAAATDPSGAQWSHAARYALAWFATLMDRADRAAAAYDRLLVDDPGGEAATRAATGLARLEVRRGDPGWAAALLDRAVQEGAAPVLRAGALRELAVRIVLRRAAEFPSLSASPVVALADTRIGAVSATPDGLLLADERRGTVVELSVTGGPGGTWALPEVHALAADDLGRRFAATADAVFRLVPGEAPTPLARLDEFGPPQSLLAVADGRLFLLDRKGVSIATVEPGATAVKPYWSSSVAKLSALVRDDGRLLAVDAKTKDVVVVESGGGARGIGMSDLARPAALAADLAGTIAVLDAKDDRIYVLGGDGRRIPFDCKAAGINRPVLAGFTNDGALQVLDASTGQWYRVQ